MYNQIFFTNVVKALSERGMTKLELSEKSGVSISFLSDLTNGKGNPSLLVMEKIAKALELGLPYLLESTDLDAEARAVLAEGQGRVSDLPQGYTRITAVLPDHKAFMVHRWNEEALHQIYKNLAAK